MSSTYVEHLAPIKAVSECNPNGYPASKLIKVGPSSVYNAMIHPFIRHTAKGVLFYGGLVQIFPIKSFQDQVYLF